MNMWQLGALFCYAIAAEEDGQVELESATAPNVADEVPAASNVADQVVSTLFDEVVKDHQDFMQSFLSQYPLDSGMPDLGQVGLWKVGDGSCPADRPYGSHVSDNVKVKVALVNMADQQGVAQGDYEFVFVDLDSGNKLLHSMVGIALCPEERRIIVIRSEDATKLGLIGVVDPTVLLAEVRVVSIESRPHSKDDSELVNLQNDVFKTMHEVFGETDTITDNDSIPYENTLTNIRERYLEDFKQLKSVLKDYVDGKMNAPEVGGAENKPSSNEALQDIIKGGKTRMLVDGGKVALEKTVIAIGQAKVMAKSTLDFVVDWVLKKAVSLTARDEL